MSLDGLAKAGLVILLGGGLLILLVGGINTYNSSPRSASPGQPSPIASPQANPLIQTGDSNDGPGSVYSPRPNHGWNDRATDPEPDDRPAPREPPTCPDCKGSGLSSTACSACRGSGLSGIGPFACFACKGRRFDTCLRCNGRGKGGYFNP